MNKFILLIAMLSPALTFAQSKKQEPKTFDLLIGTYTKGKSKGISVYRFYAETGKFAYLSEIDGVSNPSYLCLSDNNKFVYAVNENGKDGEVSSFSFEPKTGLLNFINKQSSQGADPCYVSVDKAQKNIFVANYSSGALAVLPLNKDGSIAPASQTIHDEGHGINKERQEAPHVHMALLSPDEKYLLYTDLGTDKINVTRYHASKIPPLVNAEPASFEVTAGNGPRHLEFSPDKKFVYLITEMGSNVTVFDYNSGKLKQKQVITMLPDGFSGQTAGAAIHISPDGRFLYASNRLETNDISIYSRNIETGELTFVARQPTFGKNPRDFAIDPTGNYLIVANQDSDSIFVFRIDQNSGKLLQTGNRISVGNPVCLKFAPAM